MKSKLNRMTIYHGYNIVFAEEDQDSMTDYFPMITGTLKYVISWLKDDGANTIKVDVVNNDKDIPAEKRVKRVCKELGYTYENTSEWRKSVMFPEDPAWYHLEYTLTKVNGGN